MACSFCQCKRPRNLNCILILIRIFMILATVCLLLVVLSNTPVLRAIDVVHRNVTIGKDNGFLTLGTLRYCLEVSNNKTCSPTKFPPYVIGNDQVLAQVGSLADKITKGLSIGNFLALVLGTFGTLLFAFSRPTSIRLIRIAQCCTGLGAAFAIIGLAFGIVFIGGHRTRVGVGFWITVFAFIVLGASAVLAGFTITTSKHTKMEKPGASPGEEKKGKYVDNGSVGGPPVDSYVEVEATGFMEKSVVNAFCNNCCGDASGDNL